MRREIDLHGFLAEEALIIIQKNIFDLESNRLTELIFITGKGSGVLKTTIENFVKNYNKHNHKQLTYKQINEGKYTLWFDYENNSINHYDSYWSTKQISDQELNELFDQFKK
ncbi:hypothetical protein CO229_01550 [Mycoplasmopsis bovirhinis]|uniref:Smr/MutS family protein n=1 Tax=Mycoplasmopsis bovirhinis TaxID=29553 RepID=UPI000C05B296|nr:Smr/MutS family protein [Mycoplasmopsis bovirhinis]ATO30800.1 hypothetical protein CO229_01550 [Mycoplasmopsis bovirhinis]